LNLDTFFADAKK
jgi:hypothetical protein